MRPTLFRAGCRSDCARWDKWLAFSWFGKETEMYYQVKALKVNALKVNAISAGGSNEDTYSTGSKLELEIAHWAEPRSNPKPEGLGNA